MTHRSRLKFARRPSRLRDAEQMVRLEHPEVSLSSGALGIVGPHMRSD